jgi:ribonuclease HII
MLKTYHALDKIEVGLDEVGRGCLAGPVVTAAVILPQDFNHELIRDSKKLTELQRNKAYDIILENAIAWSCRGGSVKQIDKYNINEATFIAMHKCLDELSIEEDVKFDHILVDGNQFKSYGDVEHTCVTKGDNTYTCIAAAAIIAKVRRDEYMRKVCDIYPEYGFSSHKGYGTQKHIQSIKEHGPIWLHRKKFIKNFI